MIIIIYSFSGAKFKLDFGGKTRRNALFCVTQPRHRAPPTTALPAGPAAVTNMCERATSQTSSRATAGKHAEYYS